MPFCPKATAFRDSTRVGEPCRAIAASRGRVTIGAVVTVACLLLVAAWLWSWAKANYIGDANGRLHIYNSQPGWPVDVEIHAAKADDAVITLRLTSGEGVTYRANHAGNYAVKVIAPDHLAGQSWRIDVPLDEEDSLDRIIDIGGRGHFLLAPVFYLPVELNEAERKAELRRRKSTYREYDLDVAGRRGGGQCRCGWTMD